MAVAVLIDYENVHWSMKRYYSAVPRPAHLLARIKTTAEALGTVTVAQAYADFDNDEFRGLPSEIQRISVEPRHVFSKTYDTGLRKNAADIELSLDALELAYADQDLGDFVIVSGDRDMIQIARKLHRLGRRVHIIGVQRGTSVDLKQFVDSFQSVEDLLGIEPAADVPAPQAGPPSKDLVQTILRKLHQRELCLPPGAFIGLSRFVREHGLAIYSGVISGLFEEGLCIKGSVPNPRDPEHPTSTIQLNWDHPAVRELLGPSEPTSVG